MGKIPGYRNHFSRERGISPPSVPVARVEDETGDDLQNKYAATIDATFTAFLRLLSGSNKSALVITAYRTNLSQFVRFLAVAETNSSSISCGLGSGLVRLLAECIVSSGSGM
jgi:hypothetical protein